MTIRSLFLTALLLAGAPAALAAQEQEEFCPDARTQGELNECAAEDLARADSALNEAYQEVLAMIAEERVDALRAAQRAWIRFRDAECDFQSSSVAGGRMEPMINARCQADLTRRRTEQFEEILSLDS